jgi:dihydroorotate dehydrogenase electron transfer subunit
MKDLVATVVENGEIAKNIYMITLALPESAGIIHGGQFVNLSTGDGSHLLRRPLGVCKVEGDNISVCYQLKGSGTHKLAEAKTGDKLTVLLPLGNYFDVKGYKDVVVIGGGVGIFPLIATIRENSQNVNFHSYIGSEIRMRFVLWTSLKRANPL